MKKMPSVFVRQYHGDRTVIDDVVPGCEWVILGEGIATEKLDGTSCCIGPNGDLYKRYSRKLKKQFRKLAPELVTVEHFREPPDGWIPCHPAPDPNTLHWPGWLPVNVMSSEDKYHAEAFENLILAGPPASGTYELIGPNVQNNPYGLDRHVLERHGNRIINGFPCTYMEIREYFMALISENSMIEGVVFHHPDGHHMAKVKLNDFFPNTWNC